MEQEDLSSEVGSTGEEQSDSSDNDEGTDSEAEKALQEEQFRNLSIWESGTLHDLQRSLKMMEEQSTSLGPTPSHQLQGEVPAEPTLNAFTATVIFVITIIILLPVVFGIVSMFFPAVIGSRTFILSAIASLVLLLLICVYSFWEDLKFCAIKAEYFVSQIWSSFCRHIRRRTSSAHELLLLPALIVLMSLMIDRGILVATVIGSVIFILLTLSDSVWYYYYLIIQKANSFILPVWTVYCQHIRPTRIAVKQQIFLPALMVMITLITEGSQPSVTCLLTALSVLSLRLSVRIPYYDLTLHEPYFYWISVLIPYVLKPVLIVVLVLTPALSEKRILVTGIIVIFVQLFHIPSFGKLFQCFVPPSVVALFVLGTTSSSVWILLSVPASSATFFIFNAYLEGVPLLPFMFVPSALLAVTVDFLLSFLTASVFVLVWIFLVLSVNWPEGILLTTTLILGLVMNVVIFKFGIIDIMVLMLTVGIILEANTTPLQICVGNQNAGQTKENPIFFRHVDNLRHFAATKEGCLWVDLSGELFIVVYPFGKESKILCLPESDTVLQIPNGSDGLFMMRVLTDERIYQNPNLTSENECFVSAMVVVRVFPFLLMTRKPDKVHTLKIAHCIPDRRMWSKVVVRQWSGGKCRELKRSEIPDYQEGCFYVDEHFITINTRTFSVFTCTVCEKICQTREYAVITGELSSSNRRT